MPRIHMEDKRTTNPSFYALPFWQLATPTIRTRVTVRDVEDKMERRFFWGGYVENKIEAKIKDTQRLCIRFMPHVKFKENTRSCQVVETDYQK